ncbi:hypothetical protein [Burkholderia sp. BE17]|uniref:hypothetical protein n=1 Tax=Burkholderia sp. BE17 TaxID=2656644 RepID=UPI00128C46E6|nr:hypothetical protein [Burkholderia sp. BE17]MPV67637.1 hypothetical protein [Burkholderia sp. BE17]
MKSYSKNLAVAILVATSLVACAHNPDSPLTSSASEHSGSDGQVADVGLPSEGTELQVLMQAHRLRLTSDFTGALAILDMLDAKLGNETGANPLLYTAYYDERGWTLLRMGRLKEAIGAFGSAIERQPARYDAYLGRARAREMSGDIVGSRVDYVQFARWAPESTDDRPLDSAIRLKLKSLGIDADAERLQPFGEDNPLRDYHASRLRKAQTALLSATTPRQKAEAYHDISVNFDGVERSPDALAAIDKALAIEPTSSEFKQSKVVTLVSLNQLGDALTLAEPLRVQAQREAASSDKPAAVLSRYEEVMQGAGYAYLLRRDWDQAIGALADCGHGALPYDQDYMATMYLYTRAKSGVNASRNAYFENYVGQASMPILGDYRRSLLLYWQGRATVRDVYEQILLLDSTAAIELALAELWFHAAAYEKYVRHDNAASTMYASRLDTLRPYGTNEWMLLRRGAL